MTIENLLSQMGIGSKQLTDRYSGEYGAPVQDQHVYYAYEPSPPSHGQQAASSKHHYSGGSGLKTNASMSALTLLAFLFFLHILQQCIKEHMTEMSAGPVVVMSASREGYDGLSKTESKIDKAGVKYDIDDEQINAKTDKYVANPYTRNVDPDDGQMMKINAAEHKPNTGGKYEYIMFKNDADRSSFPGVNAMNDN